MPIVTRKSAARPVSASSAGSVGDWEDAPTEITRKVVFVDVYGETGTGRTSFALHAPGPIALAHTAEKIDGIIQPFAAKKTIKTLNFGGVFSGTKEQISQAANAIWMNFLAKWNVAMDDWAKTVIMDTGTEGWELIRLARFGELNPQGRTDALYGKVNAEWCSPFKRFRWQDRCNVITIHQAKDEYVDKRGPNGKTVSSRTGRTIHAGMKQMRYMADVVVRMEREDGVVAAIIEKGWYNGGVIGEKLYDEDATFPRVMALITGDDPTAWGEPIKKGVRK